MMLLPAALAASLLLTPPAVRPPSLAPMTAATAMTATVMTAPMIAEPMRPEAWVADTVVVILVDRRPAGVLGEPLPDLVALLRTRAPDLPVISARQGLTFEADPGVLLLQVFLEQYDATFTRGFRNQWRGLVTGSVRVVDARGDTVRSAVLSLRHEARKSNLWGPKSGLAAMAEAYEQLATEIAGLATGTLPLTTDAVTTKATPAEYAPYLVSGTATLAGQAFLMTRGGDAKRAAGRDVTVDPYTTLAQDWYRLFGTDMAALALIPGDPLFSRGRRVTVADAEGRFVVSGLPAGTYLIRTVVTWEVPESSVVVQGGVVSEIVTITDTERRDVVLRTAAVPK